MSHNLSFSSLTKQDNKESFSPTPSSEELEASKKLMRNLCLSMNQLANEYKPIQSVILLNQYLEENHSMNRLLYSELSSFLFSLEMQKRATLNANITKLLAYVFNPENKVTDDCQKIVMKIYDHSQLVLYQIENAQTIAAAGIEKERERLQEESKKIEKEYITILGIFASIVLAFVGNFIFSSSVLQNISQANIYRLLLTIDLLGFVFVTIILMLIRFLYRINHCCECPLRFRHVVRVCAGIALAILLCWFFQIDQITEWTSTWLPWGK